MNGSISKRMVAGRRGQRGITFLSILLIALLVIFLAYCGMRAFPLLYQGQLIHSVLGELAGTSGGSKDPAKQLRDSFLSQMSLEGVDLFSHRNIKQHLSYKKGRRKQPDSFTMKYENRRPLFLHLELVYRYEESFTLE